MPGDIVRGDLHLCMVLAVPWYRAAGCCSAFELLCDAVVGSDLCRLCMLVCFAGLCVPSGRFMRLQAWLDLHAG